MFSLLPPTPYDRPTITQLDAMRIAASYSNPAMGPATAVLARFTDIDGPARNENRLAWIVVRSWLYPTDVRVGGYNPRLAYHPLCAYYDLTVFDAHDRHFLVGFFAL